MIRQGSDWASFRREFDFAPGLAYLNNGTHSIVPRRVLERCEAERRLFESNPTSRLIEAWGRLWEVQVALAGCFDARPEDLFLRPNVTSVVNELVMGLDGVAGGAWVLGELEYGAIANLARYRCEREGRELRRLPMPVTPEEIESLSPGGWDERKAAGNLADRIVRGLKPGDSVLLLSHVAAPSGLALPIREIARETRSRGVVLIVDGAHAVGALPLRFESELQDVDFYAGSLHKWFMGPKGTAFGWVPERNHERLRPIQAGWTTYETDVEYEGHGARASRFQGRMLASACQDFSPFLALPETIEFWRRWGEREIRDRICELGVQVEEEVVRQLGRSSLGAWSSCSPPSGELRGPLVSFGLPDALERLGFELVRRFPREYGVQINAPVIRGRRVARFSPHAYTSEQEIVDGVAALARAIEPVSS